MTQQEKEQRLLDEATKFARAEGITYGGNNPFIDVIDSIIEFAKSDFVKQYHHQETPELEELREEFGKHCFGSAYLLTDNCEEEIFNFFATYIKGTEWVESWKDSMMAHKKVATERQEQQIREEWNPTSRTIGMVTT